MIQTLTHPGCDGWAQFAERTAHCPACHETFTGLEGFDHHQTVTAEPIESGWRSGIICCPPATALREDGQPWYELVTTGHASGQWRRNRPGRTAREWTS